MSESNSTIEMLIKQSSQDVPDAASLQMQILERTRHLPQSVPRQLEQPSAKARKSTVRRWWNPLLATTAVTVLAIGVLGDRQDWYRDVPSVHMTAVNDTGDAYQLELQELLILEDDRLFAQL
ncbi:hypothetical protein GCM10008090_21480 [Arenicella chitinivorans]|uniref:DUF3619 family protein n=1 Tax=Arenicella chitinivorans TaxID=1329800 RepID=A0A918RUZ0_9GAMM|nr:hypothetical protein [Arenicella chitinivorans]GHA11421.1 hypothetical protein GCM10008090_21480 [Arenicella chitinivorans]